MLTRRQFLQRTAMAGAGLVIAGRWDLLSVLGAPKSSPNLSKFVDPLPIPPTASPEGTTTYLGRTADYYEISMQERATWQFHGQFPATKTWGYWAGDTGIGYLGPTIEATVGKPVAVKYTNSLPKDHLLNGSVDETLWNDLPNIPGDPPGGRNDNDKFPELPNVWCCAHLHGGFTPPDFDGHPESWYTQDGRHGQHYASWSGVPTAANEAAAVYPNDQPATMLWYHDHGMSITRLNVYAGLAALYLLRDGNDTGKAGNPLGLPAGSYEVPLVIQDRTFDADGSLFYPTTGVTAYHPLWVPEFFGDVPVVNGKAYPYLEVEPRRYRFRILNGSNARFYNLWFEDSKHNVRYPFTLIGMEESLLPAPLQMTTILLAPAERADVIFDFSRVPTGTSLTLMNNAKAPFPGGRGGECNQIMQFQVVLPLQGSDTTLHALPALTPLVPTSQMVKRQIVLKEKLDPATNAPIHVLLNETFFDVKDQPADYTGGPQEVPPTETPKAGDTEIWQFINLTADAHPMHLHLVQFQVVNRRPFDAEAYDTAYTAWITGGRNGSPPSVDGYLTGTDIGPAPEEAGYKDTVKAYPGQVTRIIARFDLPAGTDSTQPADYVYHCHILEHEDNEMMRPFQVLPT